MKKTVHENYRLEVVINPRDLVLVSDDKKEEVERNILMDIKRKIQRRVDDVHQVTLRRDTRYECSHCGSEWDGMTAVQAAWPDKRYHYDEHSVEGEPACCDEAIEEFRTERGIPLPTS